MTSTEALHTYCRSGVVGIGPTSYYLFVATIFINGSEAFLNGHGDVQMVMSNLTEESSTSEMYEQYDDQGIDEPMRGMNDPDWDLWEEWMGWEGAGIRDYTSHINPYI